MQKELIWKPGEFSEDTDGNSPLKGRTLTAIFPLQPTQLNWVQTQTRANPWGWLHCPATSLEFNLSFPKNQAPGSTQLAAQVPQPCGTTQGTSAELPISHLKPKRIKTIHEETVLHVDRG